MGTQVKIWRIRYWMCATRGFVAIVLLLSASAVWAQRAAQQFDIPAGALITALDRFGEQSGLQVSYDASLLQGKTAPAVHGMLSATAAMQQLLQGTGLQYRFLNPKTIMIYAPSPPPASKIPPKKPSKKASITNEQPVQLQTITVTGSRLPAVTMQGPKEVKVYTSVDIARSGQMTALGFLNTLPEVSTVVTGAGWDTGIGTATVRLRGLPVGSTLVLLDGRRIDGVAVNQNNGNYFNLDTIPVSAIERIEVLPESASAVYGSDAIGGVVNIILRKDLNGGEVNVTTGRPTQGGYGDTTASFAIGKNFDRGNITFIGSYQTRSELTFDERVLTANKDYRRFGGPDNRSTECQPGNVYSIDGSDLPGLNSSFAGIPVSSGGPLTPADFLATSGVLNTCNYSFFTTLVPSTHRGSALANGHYDLTDTTQAFFQLIYSQIKQAPFGTPPYIAQFHVPANNVYNPFGVPVLVSYRFLNEGRSTYGIGTQYFSRILVGLRGSLGDTWNWEIAAWQSAERGDLADVNVIDYEALFNAISSTDPVQSINLFSSGVPASQAVLDQILYDATDYESGKARTINGFVRGNLFYLPAGPVDVVFGGEYDHMRQGIVAPAQGLPTFRSNSRSVSSLFGEVRVPLLKGANSNSAEKLVFTTAARYDRYSDFGGRLTSQAGLEFRPIETLLLRATYSGAFKAPDLGALHNSSFPGVYPFVPDPLRGGELYPEPYVTGGNPDLRPQTGTSRMLGVVWTSKTIANLQVSLSNFRITQGDRIGTPNPLTLVTYPDAFPGRLVRAAPTPADIAKGYAGKITLIDLRYLNYGSLLVEGFDLDADYKFKTSIGTFGPSLSATEIYKYQAVVAPDTPSEDRLGYASADAFAPRWKATLALTWANGPWSARMAGRYLSSYLDYDHARILGDYWLFDASVHYDFGKTFGTPNPLLSNAYANLSVVNAFDRLAQYSNYFGQGYDPRESDIRGRFVSLTLGTRW